MTYQFVVCKLKTGEVLERDVPFTIEGDLTRVLQGHGGGSLSLPIRHPWTPTNWEHLVIPWRSLILVLNENQEILWHGIPTSRVRNNAEGPSFSCVTIEGYLLRRYVPTLSFRGVDQALIARSLAQVAGDAAGIPLKYNTPLTSVMRDREYADDENARVYNRLQELAAVKGGLSWTIDVAWSGPDRARVDYIFRTGYPYLGYRTRRPDHVFELPGNISGTPGHEERWGESDAATHIRAIGDGEGVVKPMSDAVVDTAREDADWPRLEERHSFSGVTEARTLESHAQALAGQLFGGQELVTLTARSDAGTRLSDISLGDSAVVRIKTDLLTLEQVWVVTGWSLSADQSTYNPTLQRLEA